MKNVFIIYMPTGNHEAMVHYEDTIKNKVSQDRIFRYVENGLRIRLKSVFGNKPIAVWGSRDGSQNRTRFENMEPGDDVLIVEGDTIKLLGKVAATTVNEELSWELWKPLKDGANGTSWKLIYFIANPVEIDLPFLEFKKLFGYSENWSLRGFTSISNDKLRDFYDDYDDLYSVLLRIKRGEVLEVKSYPCEVDAIKESLINDVSDELAENKFVSDHIKMQWKLMMLGKKTGSKVWVPKSDQTRLEKAYGFCEFEKEFTSGIDTPARYVEQIDVVWKEEFRIDAAFEIENSTSIYSGLLRFSDLKLIAPNSNYPLFIVAPRNRKAAVFSQVKRPTFKRLDFEKKVRYLSYEAVDEIDSFFTNSSVGLNSELLIGKSEEIS